MSDDEFEPLRDDGSPLRRAGPAELKVMSALTSSLKVSRLHALDNVIVQDSLAELQGYLTRYLDLVPHITILSSKGRVYVNNAAVKVASGGHSWVHDFLDLMERLGVAGLQFTGRWSLEATQSMLGCFGRLPGKALPPEDRFEKIIKDVAAAVKPPAEFKVYDEATASSQLGGQNLESEISPATRASFYMARLMALCESNHRAVRAGTDLDTHLKHVRQSVMKIVEGLKEPGFEQRMLALTAAPPVEDPLTTQAVNTCVLSVCMGNLLGLTRGQLVSLGFAALYHDLGRVEHGEAHNDPVRVLEEVKEGLRLTLQGGMSDATLMRMIVLHDHQRLIHGVPEGEGMQKPHLFARIVAVAHAFNELQNGSAIEKVQNPAAALRALRKREDWHETTMVDLLTDVLGRTPRGTVLRLTSGELHVVLEGGARVGHRPLTKRLMTADRRPDPELTLTQLDLKQVKGEVEERELEPLGIDWRAEVCA